ncbi:MAG: hypothetical protein VX762_01140 [Bacteroidota bacterium]|nr:hypothetical protein [Bacteroidota bacterium]MEC9209012.1 hypothetical protein [Bacteroidota bacterium]
MKKIIYLFITVVMFAFMSCGGGEVTSEESAAGQSDAEVTKCSDECQKSCCLGCMALEDHATCLADHSCCAAKAEGNCCCGDETCDGSCHGDAEATVESHDHGDHHDHE